MNKKYILAEIRRTSKQNGGKPLGIRRFSRETGISQSAWFGKYWPRWSDALSEAGFTANGLISAYEDSDLIEKYIKVARKLRRLPASGDLRMETRTDPNFPSENTFTAHLGKKAGLVSAVLSYCRNHEGFEDVLDLCVAYQPRIRKQIFETQLSEEEIGSIYLLKSGQFYKIGRTNAPGRREREIQLQLPEKAKIVHQIKTDDPVGIEAYWHNRFKSKRKNGEWFDLKKTDVKAFRLRKFM